MAREIRKSQNVAKSALVETSNPYKMQCHRDPKSKEVSNQRPSYLESFSLKVFGISLAHGVIYEFLRAFISARQGDLTLRVVSHHRTMSFPII